MWFCLSAIIHFTWAPLIFKTSSPVLWPHTCASSHTGHEWLPFDRQILFAMRCLKWRSKGRKSEAATEITVFPPSSTSESLPEACRNMNIQQSLHRLSLCSSDQSVPFTCSRSNLCYFPRQYTGQQMSEHRVCALLWWTVGNLISDLPALIYCLCFSVDVLHQSPNGCFHPE